MNLEQIIFLVVLILIAILVITVIVLSLKLAKKKKGTKADNVKIINGVRYTVDENEMENSLPHITFLKGDVTLDRDKDYVVKKDSYLIPGKYTVLSESEGVKSFNIRIDGFVRSYDHASDIVLQEGQTITPVSHSIILR